MLERQCGLRLQCGAEQLKGLMKLVHPSEAWFFFLFLFFSPRSRSCRSNVGGGPRGQYAAVGPMVTACRAQGRPVVSERCTSSEVVRLRVVDEGAYIKRCSGPKE